MTTKAGKGPRATAVLDPVVKSHEATVKRLRRMTPKEAFKLAVDAGIYTKEGKFTTPYRSLSRDGSGHFTTVEKATKANPKTHVVEAIKRKKKG